MGRTVRSPGGTGSNLEGALSDGECQRRGQAVRLPEPWRAAVSPTATIADQSGVGRAHFSAPGLTTLMGFPLA